ncbi:TIGR00341 family protein [Halobacterium wangiae]|uniref:TIGR00341 family protein n=1 Tax=Halobacterium wangiae TaxID=2902623 RepID=UPI001E5D9515|nr:TIGR00341 family protein [Halobacterium wangiae]
MRLVQFPVPSGERESVLSFLEDSEFDYTLVEEASDRDYEAMLFVPVSTADTTQLMDGLRDLGIQERGFVAVGDLETLASYRYEGSDESTGVADESADDTRIAQEELLSRAQEMTDTGPSYLVLIALSAVVATAGLLTDSAAVIVGSMVIAPLLGPAIGASVGRMIHEPQLFRRGIRAQFLGVGLAIASALAFALVVRYTIGSGIEIQTHEQIAQRMNPGALSIVIALASGIAGALAFTTGTSAVLVGVMIAAALIPPAAAVGVGAAFANPVLAVSTTILVLVNVLCINLACMAVLWIRGYRPKRYREERLARSGAIMQVGVLLVCVLVLSSFLVATTIDATQNAAFEEDVERAVEANSGTILSQSVSYETNLFSRTPTSVTVTVTEDSSLTATRLQQEIHEETGNEVSVTVLREEASVAERD